MAKWLRQSRSIFRRHFSVTLFWTLTVLYPTVLRLQSNVFSLVFTILALGSWILVPGSWLLFPVSNNQFSFLQIPVNFAAPEAEVVELVDTLCSGRSARKGMRVRISLSALKNYTKQVLFNWKWSFQSQFFKIRLIWEFSRTVNISSEFRSMISYGRYSGYTSIILQK